MRYLFLILFFSVYLKASNLNNYCAKLSLEQTVAPDEKLRLTDFGAKGDGKTDDSGSLLKAISYVEKTSSKILIVPANYVFNLGGKTIDFSNTYGIILKFEGGILLNGGLRGNRTKISAERIKVFEKIILSGTFSSTSDSAYPEWYGIYPDDNRLDIVDALVQLDRVFFDISIGPGNYFTQKGEYNVKGISGVSMAKSRIIMETDKSNTFLFSVGKIGGSVKERTYDYNYIKNVSLFITKKSPHTTLRGNKGIIIGAVHKPVVENVKIQQSEAYQRFTKSDLEEFVQNQKKVAQASVGIEFKGDSELSHLRNIYTLSDIGILFSQYTDIVYCNEFINDSGLFGIASVYVKKEAVKSQNLHFNDQSWNQGLYGFYSEDSDEWSILLNSKFENIRIEQLTSAITKNGEVVSTSIRIGKSNLIANMFFENIILSGASNGIYIGESPSGNIYFEKINLYPDITIKRAFGIRTRLLPPSTSNLETPLQIILKNVDLFRDSESYFEGGKAFQNKNSAVPIKNKFVDEVISYQ